MEGGAQDMDILPPCHVVQRRGARAGEAAGKAGGQGAAATMVWSRWPGARKRSSQHHEKLLVRSGAQGTRAAAPANVEHRSSLRACGVC